MHRVFLLSGFALGGLAREVALSLACWEAQMAEGEELYSRTPAPTLALLRSPQEFSFV